MLTRCDFNLGNIIVRDGKVILDWEYTAFFLPTSMSVNPTEAETYSYQIGKKLLQGRLDAHGEAHENTEAFLADKCNLRPYPNLYEKGQKTL